MLEYLLFHDELAWGFDIKSNGKCRRRILLFVREEQLCHTLVNDLYVIGDPVTTVTTVATVAIDQEIHHVTRYQQLFLVSTSQGVYRYEYKERRVIPCSIVIRTLS